MTSELQIEFDLRTEGEQLPDAFLDAFELEQFFESTRASVAAGLRRKFAAARCGEHGCAPKFKISGVYDQESESMDLQYHVDTCCQFFLLRVMRILNQRA